MDVHFSLVDLEPLNALFLDSLVPLGNDSDRAANGLGGDWMVTGDHADLDTGRAAVCDGVRNSCFAWSME